MSKSCNRMGLSSRKICQLGSKHDQSGHRVATNTVYGPRALSVRVTSLQVHRKERLQGVYQCLNMIIIDLPQITSDDHRTAPDLGSPGQVARWHRWHHVQGRARHVTRCRRDPARRAVSGHRNYRGSRSWNHGGFLATGSLFKFMLTSLTFAGATALHLKATHGKLTTAHGVIEYSDRWMHLICSYRLSQTHFWRGVGTMH